MKTRTLTIIASVLLSTACASQSRADIYEWAWVDPADPTQGVYQSSIVCPGGSGASAQQYTNLSGLTLTQAYLIGANLYGVRLIPPRCSTPI